MYAEEATKPLKSKIEALLGAKEVELIYYMALQPSLYEETIHQIQELTPPSPAKWIDKKIVVEKPFGFD